MGVLSELTCLALHRPPAAASHGEQAAYVERLAVAMRHLAAEASPAEAAIERRIAAAHHRHARALLAPGCPAGDHSGVDSVRVQGEHH